jgi:acetylglutamate kinase
MQSVFWADGNLIQSDKRNHPINYGFVGDVNVNTQLLETLLLNNLVLYFAITHDGSGQLLNTKRRHDCLWISNRFIKFWGNFELLFWKPGVLFDAEDDASVIENMNPICKIKSRKKPIHSGMIPKLDNCFIV